MWAGRVQAGGDVEHFHLLTRKNDGSIHYWLEGDLVESEEETVL